VEGTSFIISESHTALQIEPILYTYATQEQKQILQPHFIMSVNPILMLQSTYTMLVF